MGLTFNDKLAQDAIRAVGLGVEAAVRHLANRLREAVSTPAPRKLVTGRRGKLKGVRYYRATTPATPNAPPRKLSGKGRSSVFVRMAPDGLSGQTGTNNVYMVRHERSGKHRWMVPTLERFRSEVEAIIGGAAIRAL